MATIDTRQVKAWMLLKGLTQRDVGREAGCSQTFVSKYVRGEKTSSRLTSYFLAKGCPAKYLPEPRRVDNE